MMHRAMIHMLLHNTIHCQRTTNKLPATLYACVGADELEQLCNPAQAVFTNAGHIKVTLLKILTELEALLWAFKVIMAWACDASQTGYKFLPHQENY
jgi:hypothetical protein